MISSQHQGISDTNEFLEHQNVTRILLGAVLLVKFRQQVWGCSSTLELSVICSWSVLGQQGYAI